jgi:hypothetical protein
MMLFNLQRIEYYRYNKIPCQAERSMLNAQRQLLNGKLECVAGNQHEKVHIFRKLKNEEGIEYLFTLQAI